jgi:hypothetical protein
MKHYLYPLLNTIKLKRTEEQTIVDRKTFWEYYIRCVLIPKGLKLNEMEIDVLSIILSSDLTKSVFKGESRKDLENKYSRVRISQVAKKLKEKNIIESASDIKGDYLLTNRFKKFAEIINKEEDFNIEFCFNFKII